MDKLIDRIIPLVGLIILIACGRGPTIDPQFKPIVKEFCDAAKVYHRDCNERVVDLTIVDEKTFTDDDPEVDEWTIAYCIQSSYTFDSTNEIRFRKSYWDKMTDIERKQVTFHELGHCFLGRDHDDNKTLIKINGYNYPIYTSIMGTYYDDNIALIYDLNWDGYIKELFTHIKPNLPLTFQGKVSPSGKIITHEESYYEY